MIIPAPVISNQPINIPAPVISKQHVNIPSLLNKDIKLVKIDPLNKSGKDSKRKLITPLKDRDLTNVVVNNVINDKKQINVNRILVSSLKNDEKLDWKNMAKNKIEYKNIKKLKNVDETIISHLSSLNKLEIIDFDDEFNLEVNLKNLENLVEINYGSYFNQNISKDNLPNVKRIKLGVNYMRKLSNLPDSLEELVFDERYNNMISLPENLRMLKFGGCFDKPFLIPKKLERLEFGYHFNRTIDLPASLKYLKLSQKYNQTIKFNEGLEDLYIGPQFDKDFILPKSLKLFRISNPKLLSKLVIPQNIQVIPC